MLSQPNVLIIGASGGIGTALVSAIQQRLPAAQIQATWHSQKPSMISSNLHWHQLDASNEDQFSSLADQLPSLDWIINAAGVLHTPEKGPEKTIKKFGTDFFMHNIAVNSLPTLLAAKHCGHLLKQSQQGIFAAISARVGSISDNNLGGWISYRSSKAALNMALKTLAIEWHRSMKNVCVAALHPGTTDTMLSKPFQANVPADKLFPTQQTADYLLKIIANLKPQESGCFMGWDEKPIPW